MMIVMILMMMTIIIIIISLKNKCTVRYVKMKYVKTREGIRNILKKTLNIAYNKHDIKCQRLLFEQLPLTR